MSGRAAFTYSSTTDGMSHVPDCLRSRLSRMRHPLVAEFWADADSRLGAKCNRMTVGLVGNSGVKGCGIRASPRASRRAIMGGTEKITNAAQSVKGKVQEAAGHVTGNEDLEDEGQAEQVEAQTKADWEKVQPPE